eukprot:CAMPEP_0173432916 /NCGR_PEP_ID=MMETSP1357-20121228/10556_1 /TAXON_ID=77926 /ORGANISM="Hemiselmis rufescens, Strain PCC563" /LENGTH=116 /DNA_ID=CAMNT_0014397581 /DNA_START=92 /DNA_END=443 /DNA_ORIENTATION=+
MSAAEQGAAAAAEALEAAEGSQRVIEMRYFDLEVAVAGSWLAVGMAYSRTIPSTLPWSTTLYFALIQEAEISGTPKTPDTLPANPKLASLRNSLNSSVDASCPMLAALLVTLMSLI